MEVVDRILATKNVITAIVVLVVAVGAVKSIAGDLGYDEFVKTVEVLVAGTAVGRGLAALKK
jgi:hypothetical protein